MLRVTRFSFEKLFSLLKERRIDDWQFAREVGSGDIMIMRMLHKRSVPLSFLNRLCDKLNVSLEDIMEHEELRYPSGVSFMNYVHEQSFWSDLEDVKICEIVFKFHENKPIDEISDFRILIDHDTLDLDSIMADVEQTFDMNPDTNKYITWTVTDRNLVPCPILGNPKKMGTCLCENGEITTDHCQINVGFSLVIDVTDPKLLEAEGDHHGD